MELKVDQEGCSPLAVSDPGSSLFLIVKYLKKLLHKALGCYNIRPVKIQCP